jgi:hypothetical protein
MVKCGWGHFCCRSTNLLEIINWSYLEIGVCVCVCTCTRTHAFGFLKKYLHYIYCNDNPLSILVWNFISHLIPMWKVNKSRLIWCKLIVKGITWALSRDNQIGLQTRLNICFGAMWSFIPQLFAYVIICPHFLHCSLILVKLVLVPSSNHFADTCIVCKRLDHKFCLVYVLKFMEHNPKKKKLS